MIARGLRRAAAHPGARRPSRGGSNGGGARRGGPWLLVPPQHPRLFAAAAATSSQKRALNPDQLHGKPGAAAPKPPPPPSAPSSSSSSSSSLLPVGAAVGLAAAGGAAFYYSRRPDGSPPPSPGAVKTPPPLVAATAETPSSPPTALAETAVTAAAAPESAVSGSGGNRVTSIHVPPKMKGSAVESVPPPQAAAHPEGGHRVAVLPVKAAAASAAAAQDDDNDDGVTRRALASLRPPEAIPPELPPQTDAAESLLRSHQSLWTSLGSSSEVLRDLEGLDANELRTRAIRLAAELQHRTQWEAVRLKEFLAMVERETNERHQQALQKQRLDLEEVLARRLRDQEHELTTQLRQALHDKESAIQSLLQSALDAQQAEHEQQSEALQKATAEELQARFEREYAQKLEEYKVKVAQELQRKAATVHELAEKLRHLESALEASKSSQRGSLRAHKLSAAALALAQRLETGEPATAELQALRAAAGTEGVVPAALATIPSDASTTGVPTVPELQARFDSVYKQCRTAALVPEGRPGLGGQLAGRAFAMLKYPPGPDDAAPEDQPHHPEYVLARALRHVQHGELESAVEQLEHLTGQAAFTASDWMNDALNRIAVDKAVKVIKLECALVNESLLE